MNKNERAGKNSPLRRSPKMYLDLKDKPFDDSDYQTAFLRDFRELVNRGVTHPDIARLREILEEGGL